MKNIKLKVAAFLSTLTAIVHLTMGQVELMNPLHNSNLTIQQKAEMFGAWHIVSILLVGVSYVILRNAFTKNKYETSVIKLIGILFILFGIPFIISSIMYGDLAPQFTIMIPIPI